MKELWRNIVSEYFTFNVAQQRGVIVLVFLIVAVTFFPSVFSMFKEQEDISFDLYRMQIDSLQANMKKANSAESNSENLLLADLDRDLRNLPDSITPFRFDPNTATENDFTKLGLKSRQIKTILNYRDKGGKFYAKEDFKKIYGLKESDYLRLEPFILIPPKENIATLKESSPAKENLTVKSSKLDLNKADSLQLVSLPGIGSILSSRIIKFRDKLGGFYTVEQLKEVYGLKPESFEIIKEKIFVNASDIHKINLNEVSEKDLKQHPYFKAIAMPLISYREQHGDFTSADDLKSIDVISEDGFVKILPYLEL